MWEHFESLAGKPLMVLRGEHSDLLSAATVQEMQRRQPNLMPILVRNEGHAPLLLDRFTQRLIADFLIENNKGWIAPIPARKPIHREILET
jgi:pimeloyl-ACP methyl ester carboxylesterase